VTGGDGSAHVSRRWFTPGRKASLAGSLWGALGGLVLFGVLWRGLAGVNQTVAQALVLLVPALVVFGLSLAVAFGRFITQTFDPLSPTSTANRYLPVTQRALTNSLEQGLVFMAAGTVLVRTDTAWAPTAGVALAVTFGAARVVFWLGYLRSTFGRAPGMAVTMLVNAVVVVFAIAAIWGK
jgi:hypothetical protein